MALRKMDNRSMVIFYTEYGNMFSKAKPSLYARLANFNHFFGKQYK